MTGRGRWIAVVVTMLSVLLAAVEWITWRASRQALPAGTTDPNRTEPGETVLVLGCPLPRLQRWRVRIAIRSTDPNRSRLLFSGGTVHTAISEAQMMADYAVHQRRVAAHNVIVEERSTTTVENIVNSAPLMADSPSIKIASNTLHALRARMILREESPELAQRLVRARDYIPFEWGLLHAVMLGYEAYRYVRARVAAERAPHLRNHTRSHVHSASWVLSGWRP